MLNFSTFRGLQGRHFFIQLSLKFQHQAVVRLCHYRVPKESYNSLPRFVYVLYEYVHTYVCNMFIRIISRLNLWWYTYDIHTHFYTLYLLHQTIMTYHILWMHKANDLLGFLATGHLIANRFLAATKDRQIERRSHRWIEILGCIGGLCSSAG